MDTQVIELVGTKTVFTIGSTDFNPSYRCHLAIITEDDGQVSVVVLNLPGIGSCGSTEEEAITNAREAIAGAIESYGDDIPWRDAANYSVPAGAKQKWILVNA